MPETGFRELQRIARFNECSVCGGVLTVAFLEGQLRIRCGNDKVHQGYKHIPSYTEQYKRGEPLPAAIADRIRKKLGGESMESKALTTMDEKTMLERIEMAKFPQALKPEEKRTLALAAISYGFDPLMGELTIYQGRPYVSIDGRYRKAHEEKMANGQPVLDGVNTRPAFKEEREAWGIPDEDYFFRSEVWRKDTNHPFVGWGRVRAVEAKYKDGFRPIETNPHRMAEKRAEAQALRKAFYLPLPSLEEPEGELPSPPPVKDITRQQVDKPQDTSPEPPVPGPEGQEEAPKGQTPEPLPAEALRSAQSGEAGEADRPATERQREAILTLQAKLGDPKSIPAHLSVSGASQVIKRLNARLGDRN